MYHSRFSPPTWPVTRELNNIHRNLCTRIHMLRTDTHIRTVLHLQYILYMYAHANNRRRAPKFKTNLLDKLELQAHMCSIYHSKNTVGCGYCYRYFHSMQLYVRIQSQYIHNCRHMVYLSHLPPYRPPCHVPTHPALIYCVNHRYVSSDP